MPPVPSQRQTEPSDVALRNLLGDIVSRCEAFEVVAERVARLERRAHGEPALIVRATGELVRRLDRLSGQIAALEALPGRVDAVEATASRLVDHQGGPDLAGFREQVDALRARLDGLESTWPRLDALEQDRRRLTSLAELLDGVLRREKESATSISAINGVTERLTALEEASRRRREGVPPEVGERLGHLTERLTALEEASRRGREGVPPEVGERLEHLTERLAALEGSAAQVAVLEQSVASLPTAEALVGLRDGLDRIDADFGRLSSKVQLLDSIPERVEALGRDHDRIAALDKVVAGLVEAVKRLSAEIRTVKADDGAPMSPAEVIARMEALDAGFADLAQSVARISSQVTTVDGVPGRVAALEQAAPEVETLVRALVKRVDRLSTLAAKVKEVPERLDSVERAVAGEGQAPQDLLVQLSARTDTLARGLSGAIDTIDQLVHQVTTLERAVLG